MSKRSADEMKAREDDRQVASVAESVGYTHAGVPKEVLEEMAEEALAKTEDAPIQGLRIPLAQHDVTVEAVAWERSHGSDSHDLNA